MSEKERFAEWAVLELMGHRRLAGMLTEQQIAGVGFLRIDVPADDEHPAATQFYAPGSVYAITPCTEQTARDVARGSRPAPVSAYDVPRLSAPAPRCTNCGGSLRPGDELVVDDDGDMHHRERCGRLLDMDDDEARDDIDEDRL